MAFQKGQSGNPTGRPRKADKNRGAVERAEKQIRDRLPELIENMFRLASGVTVQEFNPVTGQPQIYERAPDRAANQYLIDRIMGKPTERKELSGEIATVGLTLDQWKAQAAARRDAAEQAADDGQAE